MDVTQEAWIGVVKGLGGLHDPARFRAWSYRIVANKARDHIRREQARRKTSPEDGVLGFVQMDDDRPGLDQLRRAIGRLSEDQRTLLSLYYGEDLSVSELAVVLEVPRGTVKSRLYHARKALKNLMEAEEES